MELDFTVVSEELGKTHIEELKPSGATTVVTNENRIEYIHLVADYKLNKQIRSQTNAFRQGLADVINLGEFWRSAVGSFIMKITSQLSFPPRLAANV